MNDGSIWLGCLVIGLGVVPVIFLVFCGSMVECGTHWLCYPAYFFLFGIIGGVVIALGLSPSGLAATCIFFLATAAPAACLCSALALNRLSERGPFEKWAMILCYAYSGFFLAALTLALLCSLAGRLFF